MTKRLNTRFALQPLMKNILLSPSLWGNRPPRGIPSERGEMAYRVKCGEHEEEMMEDPLDPLPAMDRERDRQIEI